jgi:hypothetical protein
MKTLSYSTSQETFQLLAQHKFHKIRSKPTALATPNL